MGAIMFLLLIGLLGLGTINDIKAKEAQELCLRNGIRNGVPQYNLLVVLAAGLAMIIALISFMINCFFVGILCILVSVLVCFGYIKQAAGMIAEMKKAGWGSGGMLTFQPYWVWARIVLLGMGKWMHVVMCCTLVGIPLYNMMKTVTVNVEALQEQIELRQEYERIHGRQ